MGLNNAIISRKLTEKRDMAALTVEEALREILGAIRDMELIGEFEGGAMGDGDVVRAYRALGEPLPDWVREYLGDMADADLEEAESG